MLQPLCLGIYEAGEKKKKHIKYYWNLETLWLGLIKPVSFFSSWKKNEVVKYGFHQTNQVPGKFANREPSTAEVNVFSLHI